MASTSGEHQELIFLILHFLNQHNFKETARELEKESGVYFSMRYVEEAVREGEWKELEDYISGFTSLNENVHSVKIFYEIRKEKYLEALYKGEHSDALEVLRKDLKVFSKISRTLLQEITFLLTLSDFSEDVKLSRYYKDTKTARCKVFVELKRLIEANPLLNNKLEFPKIDDFRLQILINQSLNWQHKLCKFPKNEPVFETLYVDHTCGYGGHDAMLYGANNAMLYGANNAMLPSPSSPGKPNDAYHSIFSPAIGPYSALMLQAILEDPGEVNDAVSCFEQEQDLMGKHELDPSYYSFV